MSHKRLKENVTVDGAGKCHSYQQPFALLNILIFSVYGYVLYIMADLFGTRFSIATDRG
jgi:hypothetical protein